jgi:hypothetical protein
MKQDFTRYKEADSVTKWNSAFLFTNKPTRNTKDGGTDEERAYKVNARRTVEDHQSKLREKELELI